MISYRLMQNVNTVDMLDYGTDYWYRSGLLCRT